MANAFGGFLHTSPLSNLTSSTSQPPEPLVGLASNCIRDYFGPVVQTVADALNARGSSTLQELVANVRHHCLRDWNEERGRLVDRLNGSVDDKHKKRKGKEGSPTTSSTDLSKLYYHGGKVNMNKARGSESTGFVTNASHVRAALIVLLHHSLIKVSGGSGGSKHPGNKDAEIKQKPDPSSPQTHYTYTFLTEKARLLPRYPRYVEHASSTMDEHAAQLVECLLFSGRMRGEDAIFGAWDVAKGKLQSEDSDDEDNPFADAEDDDDDDSKNNKALKDIVQSFKKLVEGGYIVMVKPIATNQDLDDLKSQKEIHDDGINGGEVEFDINADGTIVGEKKNEKKRARSTSSDGDGLEVKKTKKQKVSTSNSEDNENRDDSYGSTKPHHPRILSLLSTLRRLIPNGSVFSVNTSMFHTSLRAEVISRLVSEMYPDESSGKSAKKNETNNMKYVGDVVNAALTYAARQEHAPLDRMKGVEESEEERHHRMAEWGTFSPNDIVAYLPEEVTKSLKSQVGGLNQNLSTLLVQMSALNYPPIALEVEEALGHPKGGKFEVCTRQLLQRMRARIQHQVLTTHHSLVAARIVSVLQMKGHCESDALAEDAMVPAKEAREILHRLHRDKYINLFDMHMTKTHNTGTAIFLWDVMPSRLLKTVINNICTALLNLRLRRQHEVEVGKDWMDRAKEAGATEENVHEEDKKKYLAFCKGLERLDCACLQLDESMMVMKDFG
mmetsp:Transcript_11646/g.25521  ORF Transcript_11646/g.25521 Transcript_11646/m.25521 type:complete len:726 (+) Transcript_11646:260-2437(+)|eukprot:CAMPEP_0172305008 /NCGR_PEP_ID=MMETSP1058-20130122/6335_1 /TAXON_ID=83371 /ORGANISM="Detonula confervacea, Strain CCMP 353" /LENGTH=725 /DNA_ID=CAMNT_0013016449 /DNA_START=210 /DNA_END=2387 /DNA_ORIENTATION=+